jgi:hypothetical protein
MKCASCEGVAHPATGCAWSPSTLVCAACARRFWAWVQRHTDARPRMKKGKPSPDFYGAALHKP